MLIVKKLHIFRHDTVFFADGSEAKQNVHGNRGMGCCFYSLLWGCEDS